MSIKRIIVFLVAIAFSTSIFVSAYVEGSWKNTVHVGRDEIRTENGSEDILCHSDPRKAEACNMSAGINELSFFGWISANNSEITGFSYTLNGGEKKSDASFKVAPEPALETMGTGKYESRFLVKVPVASGTQIVRIYANFADGTYENIWKCQVNVGTATEFEDNYQPEVLSGKHGDNITWKKDSDGTLTISGTGDMADATSASWKDDRLHIKKIIINKGITSIGERAFTEFKNVISVSLPDTVTKIDEAAFANCYKLTAVNIPDNVTVIGDSAFDDCQSLASLKFSKKLTHIGRSAFFNCSSLTSVKLGDSVTHIGTSAFSNCVKLSDISLGNNIKEIGINILYDTAYYNDKSNWDGSVLYIGKYLIGSREDISGNLSIKNGTLVIAASTFYARSNLTSVTIPGSVETVSDSAFYGCNRMQTLTIGNGVKNIGYIAFAHCSALKEVKIPNSVENIGGGAFGSCENLKTIIVGKGVKTLGNGAFQSPNVTDIYYLGSWEEWIKISKVDPTDEVFYEATIHYNSKTPSEFNTATTDAIVTGAPTENDLPVVTDAFVETSVTDITDTYVTTDDIMTTVAEITENTADDSMMSENEIDTEKADDTKTSETDGENGGEDKSSPLPIIIAAAAVTVCVALGIIFVIKKKK